MTTSVQLTQAPVLSTPESQLFEDPTPPSNSANEPRLTDEQLWEVYEISRTAREIVAGGYKRAALQFPDLMLRDAPRIVDRLDEEIRRLREEKGKKAEKDTPIPAEVTELEIQAQNPPRSPSTTQTPQRTRLYILADTSYGSCCVDEIAAEHANADVVIHYGRSCLSPTSRLPVIYIFTTRPLDIPSLISTFTATFPQRNEKIVLLADITYQSHIPNLTNLLHTSGYTNLISPPIIHNPSSLIPNRQLSPDVEIDLRNYELFHVSNPPTALLLTLNSRVKNLYIYPTTPTTSQATTAIGTALLKSNTTALLRRRYALLTKLTTTPILGILLNTLSVSNYLSTLSSLQTLISLSSKKSYTFVVGKINAAKIANFSEIGGWIVVGCWESSLVGYGDEGGDRGDFGYRPVVTPFELGLALVGDERRVWDGGWEGGWGGVEEMVRVARELKALEELEEKPTQEGNEEEEEEEDDSESEPPEFDLRTGKYVMHSRPMKTTTTTTATSSSSNPNNSAITSTTEETTSSTILTRRTKTDLAVINGTFSPGAEYLRNERTWTGLGSDFQNGESEGEAGTIEEGRSGVARGYVVGDGAQEKR